MASWLTSLCGAGLERGRVSCLPQLQRPHPVNSTAVQLCELEKHSGSLGDSQDIRPCVPSPQCIIKTH